MKYSMVISMLLGCVSFLCLPTSGRAEIVVAESIEWVLASSDRVVGGKVIQVDKVTGPDKKDYQVVTVAISKTIKGEHGDHETFLLHHYIYSEYAKQWMGEGIPVLFCLVKNDGKRIPFPADKFAWVLREDGNLPDAVLLGKSKHDWTGCVPVLTRDFQVLTDKESILKLVERTVNAGVKRRAPRRHTLNVPSDTAVYRELWAGSAVRLIVPIDEQLEVLGRKWCRSASPWEREEGAQILGHFKNEMNVELLKSLLNHPSNCESTLHRTVRGKSELELVYRKKLYYVRQAAFDALRELRVKVDRPILEELLEGRDDPAPKKDNPSNAKQ
jgi:hypothetical protein